jgi:cytochrome c peroxidase
VADIVEFLRTLTDPCLHDRACYGRWIPAADEAPDALQLNAVDATGQSL